MEVNKQHQRLQKAYDFFKKAENTGHQFTLEEVSQITGWSIETVKAYRSKKWRWFLEEKQNLFAVQKTFHDYPKESFFRIHSQSTDNDIRNLRPRLKPAVDNLIDKARESALLAVQIYNNPLTTFRTPGFLALMHIAFTALFHAIFEKQGIEYIYKSDDGVPLIIDGDTKAWELSKCADTYYGDKTTPERENLRFLTRLRNKIEHRYLPELDLTISGHCQAMLFNFEALLKKEFGPFFALSQSLALAIQFSEVHPSQREIINNIQQSAYNTVRKFIDAYQMEISTEILQSPQYSFRVYLIPRTGNHATSSNLTIEYVPYDPKYPEKMEQLEKQITFLKEKKIQVADQGKLRVRQVVQLVRDRTGLSFNTSDHTKAWKLYGVRPNEYIASGCNTEYCQFSEAFKDFIYTQKWVDFLIKKISDPTEYQKIKKYKIEQKVHKKNLEPVVSSAAN